MKFDLILLCAGSGERMSGVEKPFIQFNDVELWSHSIVPFLDFKPNQMIMVLPKQRYENTLYKIAYIMNVVEGGDTRNESIQNALKHVKSDYVMIHDGVRPFVKKLTVEALLERCEKTKGAVAPIIPIDFTPTLNLKPMERELIHQIITPYIFPTDELKSSLMNQSVVKSGHKDPFLINSMFHGNYDYVKAEHIEGLKLTYPYQQKMFERLLE